MARLEALAETRTALADVRPGPLGTLDVYLFTDGTTLCLTPGHRETAERLAEALREGETLYLLGGSGVAGAYALTFSRGDDGSPENADAENAEHAGNTDHVYILADRVIASL